MSSLTPPRMPEGPLKFRRAEGGELFEVSLCSSEHPEPSWFLWVTGLPEELQQADEDIYTVNEHRMVMLSVCSSQADNSIFRNADGAVMCQITGVANKEAMDVLLSLFT